MLSVSQRGGVGTQCRFHTSGKMGMPLPKSKLKPRNSQSQRVGVLGGDSLVQTHHWGPTDNWLYGPTTNAESSPEKSQCAYFPVKPNSVEKVDWIKLARGPQYLQFDEWRRQDPWTEPMDLFPEMSHCSLEPECFHPPQLLLIGYCLLNFSALYWNCFFEYH